MEEVQKLFIFDKQKAVQLWMNGTSVHTVLNKCKSFIQHVHFLPNQCQFAVVLIFRLLLALL